MEKIEYYGVPDATPGFYSVTNAFIKKYLTLEIFEHLVIPRLATHLGVPDDQITPGMKAVLTQVAKGFPQLEVSFKLFVDDSFEPVLSATRAVLEFKNDWHEAFITEWTAPNPEYTFDEFIEDDELDFMNAIHQTSDTINLELELTDYLDGADLAKEKYLLQLWPTLRRRVPSTMPDRDLVRFCIGWYKQSSSTAELAHNVQKWIQDRVMNGLMPG